MDVNIAEENLGNLFSNYPNMLRLISPNVINGNMKVPPRRMDIKNVIISFMCFVLYRTFQNF